MHAYRRCKKQTNVSIYRFQWIFNANVFSELAVHTESKMIIFASGLLQGFRLLFSGKFCIQSARRDVAEMENGQRATGNGQRATGNGQRETLNGKRETECGKRETECGKRETECGKRETGNGMRETGNGERGTGNGERGNGNGSLGNSIQR